MARFSSTDVALEAFRLTRERPWLLLIWAGVTLIEELITKVVQVGIAGRAIMQFRMIKAGDTPDPAVVLPLLQQMMPASVLVLVITLIYSALMYAAGNRAVLRPQPQRLGSLGLGVPELLQLAVLVVLNILFFLLFVGLFLLVALAGGVATAVSAWMSGLVMFLGAFASLCLFVWIAVRLSLTSAISFDTGRLAIPESWRATRGRFWPLLGAYLLAALLFAIIALLALIIVFALAAIVQGGLVSASQALGTPDSTSLATFFTPAMLVELVIEAFISAVGVAVLVCTPAEAYRELKQGEAGLASAPTSV